MKTTTKLVLVGAVLVLFGCDEGDPAAMAPQPDAGSAGTGGSATGGAAGDGTGGTAGTGSGGAAGAPSGSGGTAGVAGTGGAPGTGGVIGAGGSGGVQGTGGTAGTGGVSGTGGTGGAPGVPVCMGTVRSSGSCLAPGEARYKKKNGVDCVINCSTIPAGTANVGPPAGPECVFGPAAPMYPLGICVASCSECS